MCYRVCSDVTSEEDCRYEDNDGTPYIPLVDGGQE